MSTKLDGHEIHAFLDAGGMGEVFRARDLKLGRALCADPSEKANQQDPITTERRAPLSVARLNRLDCSTRLIELYCGRNAVAQMRSNERQGGEVHARSS